MPCHPWRSSRRRLAVVASRLVSRSRLARDQCGAAVAETALTFPLVAFALLGLIDFSRYAYTQAALTYAAGEAARYAVVREGQVSDASLRAYAAARLYALDADAAVIGSTSAPDPRTNANVWRVTITYPFRFVTPFLDGGNVDLSGRSSGFVLSPAQLAPS